MKELLQGILGALPVPKNADSVLKAESEAEKEDER